jgi:hypothetical protein
MGAFGKLNTPVGIMMSSIGSKIRKKATAGGVPEGLWNKIKEDHSSKIGEKPFMDSFVGGMTTNPSINATNDVQKSLLKKKKNRTGTLLSKTKESSGKSLLGS